MVVTGGGDVGGGGASGKGQGKAPPPGIFSKVSSKYTPLVLPATLHNFPENYMKNITKFTGKGYLIMTQHITFFFINLLISLGLKTRMFTQGC
jgi:hypothetical protein